MKNIQKCDLGLVLLEYEDHQNADDTQEILQTYPDNIAKYSK